MQLFLDKDADVNAQGGRHGNELQVAIALEHTQRDKSGSRRMGLSKKPTLVKVAPLVVTMVADGISLVDRRNRGFSSPRSVSPNGLVDPNNMDVHDFTL